MAKFLSALETGGGCRSGSSRSAGIEPMVYVIKARSRANPSVEPSLGWTYLSREALARATAQMDEESTGVRADIGFSKINLGNSDLFIPGTSVLHKPTSHLLLFPWFIAAMAIRKTAAQGKRV